MTMEDNLHGRVIGQHDAVVAVSDAVRRARAGLRDCNRPIGSFIFLSPTGVRGRGLARALAEFMFDDENNMLRIDMSEFMEKLLGGPADRRLGVHRLRRRRPATEAIKRRPYSVVLLDEIEEATPTSSTSCCSCWTTTHHGLEGSHHRLQEHRLDHDQQHRCTKDHDAAGDREEAKTAVMEERSGP